MLARLIEELGVWPLMALLTAFGIFVWLLLPLLRSKPADYRMTIAASMLCFLTLEIVLNVLQVAALLPKINVNLPIAANISESSVFTFVLLGILAAMDFGRINSGK